MESKTGIKTVDKLTEIPVVNSAVSTATDYYGKVKETNSLLRTSCNLAELSFKTFKFAATPITYLCKKPIESVDTYLSDKVDLIENTYPSITKPTDQLTAEALSQAKDIYDKNVKNRIETLSNIKEKTVTDLKQYGTNKMQQAIRVGTEGIVKSAEIVDQCLENKFAKMLTDPVLDFTEKSLDYLLPPVTYAEMVAEGQPMSEEEAQNPTSTVKRIYNINKRIYASTFRQLSQLHFRFEYLIEKLDSLKSFFDRFYSASKSQISSMVDLMAKSSLAAQCANYIEKNNISWSKFETLSRSYYKAIMAEANQMLENYMKLVKNFPLVFNGTKLKQTIESFREQINMESFSANLKLTIDYLKTINEALVSYTKQMFQVVSDSKFLQSIKRITSQDYQQQHSNTNHKNVTQSTHPLNRVDLSLTANKSSKPLPFFANLDEKIEELDEEEENKQTHEQEVNDIDDLESSKLSEERESIKHNSTLNETSNDDDDEVSTEVNKSINELTQQVESNLSNQSTDSSLSS